MNTLNYPILLVCYLSLFIFGFVELCRGTLYPQILAAFSIGAGLGSLFFTTSSFVGLITNLSAPKWLAKFGKLRALHFALIFYLFGAVFLGLSAYLGITVHFLGAFFVGVGSTGVGITINVLTAEATPPEYRGKALSGLHSMYALAALLAPIIVSWGTRFEIQWNYYFFFAALGTLALILKTGLLLRKETHTRIPSESKVWANWKQYMPYALLFGFYVSGEVLTSTRLAFFLEKGVNLPAEESRDILFRYFLFFFLGRAALVFINVKKHTYNLLKACLLISISCSIAGIYLSVWYFPLAGLGMSGFFPMAMDLVSDRFPLEKQSVVSVIFLFVGIMISIFHFSFGQIVVHAGLRFSILLIPTLHLICYFLLLVLRPRKKS